MLLRSRTGNTGPAFYHDDQPPVSLGPTRASPAQRHGPGGCAPAFQAAGSFPVDARHRSQRDGGIRYRARHRSRGILAMRDGNNPPPADRTHRGFDPRESVGSRWADDRSLSRNDVKEVPPYHTAEDYLRRLNTKTCREDKERWEGALNLKEWPPTSALPPSAARPPLVCSPRGDPGNGCAWLQGCPRIVLQSMWR